MIFEIYDRLWSRNFENSVEEINTGAIGGRSDREKKKAFYSGYSRGVGVRIVVVASINKMVAIDGGGEQLKKAL